MVASAQAPSLSHSSAHPPIPLQDQLALVEQLAHRPRHLGFALDPLDVEILGMLVRPVIGVHRLSERLRSSLPVAVMVAITMGARLALPGYGPALLRHLLPFLRLLALLCLLPRAPGRTLPPPLPPGGHPPPPTNP